jgi:hypothetical protein
MGGMERARVEDLESDRCHSYNIGFRVVLVF